MKKKTAVKLSLKRATLKSLVSANLRGANGGTDDTYWCCENTGSCCYTNQYSDCIDFTIFVCW